MKYKIFFQREAQEDAVEAAAYLAEHAGMEVALRWYDALDTAMASLGDWPRRCPPAREQGAFPGVELRQRVFMSHRLIFAIRGREVHVLHVRHVARDDLSDISN